jgi:hypothetical protein
MGMPRHQPPATTDSGGVAKGGRPSFGTGTRGRGAVAMGTQDGTRRGRRERATRGMRAVVRRRAERGRPACAAN